MPLARTRLQICQVTKLIQYVREQNTEKIEKICQLGVPFLVNINEANEGLTALIVASETNYFDTVKCLLGIGAHPDVIDFKGRTALMVASHYGHVDCVRDLLAADADVNVKDSEGKTVLAYCLAAPTSRHQQCLKQILEKQPNVNIAGPTGRTALYEACLESTANEDSIIELLENGADPNCIDKETGRSALMEASLSGSAVAVKALLERGADADVVDRDRRHAVHEAAKGGHFNVLVTLSGFGAIFDQIDNAGNTPVHFAAKGHAMCCKFLSQRGSNPKPKNAEGQLPRVIAKDGGFKDCVREIKKVEKTFGKTVLKAERWAIALYDYCQTMKSSILETFNKMDEEHTGRIQSDLFLDWLLNISLLQLPEDAIKKLPQMHASDGMLDYNDFLTGKKYLHKNYLLSAFVKKEKKKKKKKGKKSKKGGKPPVHVAIQDEGPRTLGGNPPQLYTDKFLLYTDNKRFNRDSPPVTVVQDDSAWYIDPPENQHISIIDATRRGDFNTLTNAFLKGLPVDTRDRYYKTALMVACGMGNLNIAKFLIECGAEINAKDNFKWTAMHHACNSGKLDVVQMLLDNGAELNPVALGGATPLMKAIETSRIDLVQFMIDRGARVQIENRKGLNPVDIAVQWADPRVWDAVKLKLDSLPPPPDKKKAPKSGRKSPRKSATGSARGDKAPREKVKSAASVAQERNTEMERLLSAQKRAEILKAAAALAKELEQKEDASYTPLKIWPKIKTTGEMVADLQQRRARFGWQVDFPDFRMPFHVNMEKRVQVQGGLN